MDEYTIITRRDFSGVLTEVYCGGNFSGFVGERLLAPDEVSKYAERVSQINAGLLQSNEGIEKIEVLVI